MYIPNNVGELFLYGIIYKGIERPYKVLPNAIIKTALVGLI